MKHELQKRVQKILPERLSENVIDLYKRGRAKFVSAKYGNPASTVRVIAVTGKYGKTTTARLITEILKEAGRTVTTRIDGEGGGQESDLVTELQQGLKKAKQNETEFFVLEIHPELITAGVLSGVTIDTVVVTSACHEATTLLERVVNYAVVPDGYQAGMLALAEHQIISFGEQEGAEMKIEDITLYRKGTEIQFTIDHHTSLTVATHLVGTANAYNLAAAVATAYVLGVALDNVDEGAARLEELRGNYYYVPGQHPYSIVVDKAHEARSIQLLLESAKQLTKRRLIVGLLADGISDETIAQAKKLSDRLILVSTAELALPGVETVSSTEEAWLIAQRAAKKDDTVLLLGAGFADDSTIGFASMQESE